MTVSHKSIRSVTSEDFESSVLNAAGPVAVEFMSYGCEHCRMIEPVLEEVANELASSEAVFRVNVAVERDLADQYDIQATPTFVMFLNGTETGRSAGPTPSRSAVWSALTEPFDE